MLKVVLLFIALTISCSSNGSSSGPRQDFSKPTATQQSIAPSPLPSVMTKTEFSFKANLGAAEMTSKTEMCLVIPNDNLVEGDKVAAIFAGEPKSQSLVNTIVQRKLDNCGRKNHETSGKVFYYSLKVVDGSYEFESQYQELNPVAIAFVGNSQAVSLQSGVVIADLNGDGKVEYFRSCTSTEGVHLTVWTGRPLESERQWHWYIDLNFETVPSCTTKDYEG